MRRTGRQRGVEGPLPHLVRVRVRARARVRARVKVRARRERGVERPLPHVAVADGWVVEQPARPLATLAEDLARVRVRVRVSYPSP